MRAMAAYGALAGVGTAAGLLLGGVLTTTLSWRYGFLLNVPVGIAAIVAAPRVLDETERHAARLDVAGALGSTLGATALVFGIVHSADVGWTAASTIATVAAGVVLLAGFLLHQGRAAQPLLPLRLFADRRRAGAYGARFLFNGALVSFFFFMTQYLQGVAGFSALEAGLAFLPVTAAVIVAAMVTARLRVSSHGLAVAGCFGMLVGTAWVSRVSMDTPYLLGIAVPMVIFGLGQGLGLSSLTTAGMARVEPRDAGVAGGLVNVSHHLGGAVGVGILVTVFAAAGPTLADQVAAALTGACVLLALALIVILATTRSEGHHADHPQQHRHPEGPGRLVHR